MSTNARLQYLDWMRGLAVLLMIETHVFDSFLRFQLRGSESFWLSQYLGGMPAPMFLFMAGVSLALVLDRLRGKGANTSTLVEKVIRRGAWIMLLALAFRVEQVAVWFPYSDWSQIRKVDILNCIAVSYLAAGLCAIAMRERRRIALLSGVIAAVIVIVTPWVFLVHNGLPTFVLEYLNGAGHPKYFMIFSWAGFTFAGAATGYLLLDARASGKEEGFILRCGLLGAALWWVGFEINGYPWLRYGFVDYSLTSPQYFVIRLGYMFIFLYLAYRWCGRRTGNHWSPLMAFGQTSLLIYWVHIEFVYGRLRIFRNSLGVGATAAQLLWLVPLMLALSVARLKYTERRRSVIHAT